MIHSANSSRKVAVKPLPSNWLTRPIARSFRMLGEHAEILPIGLSLVGISISLFSLWFSVWQTKATEEQATAAKVALEQTHNPQFLDALLTAPRAVAFVEGEIYSSVPRFCFVVKNLGRYPTAGYEIFSLSEGNVPRRIAATTQPLVGDSFHKYCLDQAPKDFIHLMVVSTLPTVSLQSVLPFTNYRWPEGKSYWCEAQTFRAVRTNRTARFEPVVPSTSILREHWNATLPTILMSDVNCANQSKRF